MSVSTVGNSNFPNYDVTHKPKRMQSAVEDERNTDADDTTVNVTLSSVPQSVTLESAITYFKNNASGANKQIFSRTATWLEELRQHINNDKKAKSAAVSADNISDEQTLKSAT